MRVDEQLRPVDRHGTVIPHRLSPFKMLRDLGALKLFQPIPERFWRPPPEDSGEDPRRVAIVDCPCGCTPNVTIADVRECECGRFYLFLGRQVRSAFGPNREPEVEASPEG